MRAIYFFFQNPLIRTGSVVFISLLLVTVTGLADDEPTPIIVAVDTSRSLSVGELRRTTDSVLQIVQSLPNTESIGVLAFDDGPRWVMEPPGSVAELGGVLASLTPRGDFTVLNDALFTAARSLPDGGVILLLTDGRDENSATTVEDVAGLCAANKVRVVPLSTGRWIDEKAMRRYALLSEGEYLGRFLDAEPDSVSAKLTELHRALVDEKKAERAAAAAVLSRADETREEKTSPVGATIPQEPIVAAPWWLLPAMVLLLVAVLVSLFLLWRLRRPPVDESNEEGDGEWETDPALTPTAVTGDSTGFFDDMDSVPPNAQEADELNLDPSAFERLPFDGDIDKTSVLDEQPVLTVMEPGKPLRTFRLNRERAFAVGRAPKVNTLTLDDLTLSGQHFKIVPHDGGFVLVDLEATNGTLLNGRRIRARLLDSGDSIRAGEVEFEFKTILKSLG